MNPLMCGNWDGVNLWLQWDDVDPAKGYDIQLRYAKPIQPVWGNKWISIPSKKRPWAIVPTWKEGSLVQARVRVSGGNDADWVSAMEIAFLRSTCDFEISSETKDLYFAPPLKRKPVADAPVPFSAMFTRQVDGGACAYLLTEELSVAAGTQSKVTLQAAISSGWSQLDFENHFDHRPSLGVRIRNLGPSVGDVVPTGRAFTQMVAAKGQQILVAFGANRFQEG